jgi:hypothetical protein
MATRSNIAVQRRDGTYKVIYCHWDGYPTGVGTRLINFYNSQELAEALVEPGDISYIEKRCDGAPGRHTSDTPVSDQTVYYGRDRGEEGTEGVVGNTLEECNHPTMGGEYFYLWENRNWLISDDDGEFVSLIDIIKKMHQILV